MILLVDHSKILNVPKTLPMSRNDVRVRYPSLSIGAQHCQSTHVAEIFNFLEMGPHVVLSHVR